MKSGIGSGGLYTSRPAHCQGEALDPRYCAATGALAAPTSRSGGRPWSRLYSRLN